MCYYSLVVAEMCAASALISIGSVLGKTNLVQLILITLLEVSGFILNHWLLQTLLRASSLSCISIRSSGQVYSHHIHDPLCNQLSLMAAGPPSEQHHAAAHFWGLFWTHADLHPQSEHIRI